MKYQLRLLSAVSIVAASLLTGAAYSEDVVVRLAPPSHIVTAKELRNAKPFKNRLPAPDTTNLKAEGLPIGVVPGSTGSSTGGVPRAFGSFGIPFAETRVQLGATNQTSASSGFAYLASTFPYRAIGQLFFTAPDGDSTCSASVIRRGIIVTAAHCIEDFGGGATTFRNYQFIPGHDGRAGANAAQQRPYGAWVGRAIVRPASWANGTDRGCDAARDNDLAVIALNPNAKDQLIGDVVGQLNYGWNSTQFVKSARTGNFATAATSTLGYPALLDNADIMQRADGPSYLTTVTCTGSSAPNIWQGNSFTGGASGGPWIVNFNSLYPAFSGGAGPGAQAGPRIVIGVTSWGSADPNVAKDNYSSRFGQNTEYPAAAYDNPSRGAGNIAALLTSLCNSAVGGGFAGSYEANGWCD